MKCEPLIKDVSYSENVVKLPSKPLTVNPHSKPSSVEGRDSAAPRSRAHRWRLGFRQMEVTAGIARVHVDVRSFQTTFYFFLPPQTVLTGSVWSPQGWK